MYTRLAFAVEESTVDEVKWDREEIGFERIKVIRERLFLTGYGWPIPLKAPYKRKIDIALVRLASFGLIDHWYANFSHKEKEHTGQKFKLRESLGEIHLNLRVLQGAFIFLCFGWILATLCFILEHVTKKYNFRFYTCSEWFWIGRKCFNACVFLFNWVIYHDTTGRRNLVASSDGESYFLQEFNVNEILSNSARYKIRNAKNPKDRFKGAVLAVVDTNRNMELRFLK